jgi:Tfp pilus assembly protein PilF
VTYEVHGPATVGVIAAAAMVGLVLAYQSLDPLRASHASRSGATALLEGQGNAALDAMTGATERAPDEDAYWLQRGRLLQTVGQTDLARQNYATALERDPRAYDVLIAAAEAARAAEDTAEAERLAARLKVLDPAAVLPTP